jgi:hypothetical protein
MADSSHKPNFDATTSIISPTGAMAENASLSYEGKDLEALL